MGRPRKEFPPVPKASGGKMRVWWGGRYHHLGLESDPDGWRAEYARLVELWRVDPHASPRSAGELLLVELFRDYLASADAPTDDRLRGRVVSCLALLAELHRETAADAFGPPEFLTWQRWVCRLDRFNATSVKHFRDIIKRVYKWGVFTGRVAADRWQALRSVPPPKAGEVRPGRKVQPARAEDVDLALPFMPGAVRAVVTILRHSAARPSEVLCLRPGEVDRSGPVWVLRPKQHKGRWRGKERAVYLPAEAQAALALWLEKCREGEYVFRPERNQTGSRKPRYDHRSLGLAVRRACRRAKTAPFSPYQLRHLRGTEVRKSHGLEHARAVLGQSYKSMTDHYSASADADLATEVVRPD